MQIRAISSFIMICASIALAASISPKIPSLKNGCYQIGTAEELFGFAEISAQRSYNNPALLCAKLTADITINTNVLDSYRDLNPDAQNLVAWTPIMNFAGTFDGNGKTISGLYVNDTNSIQAGLFGSTFMTDTSDYTLIKDLGIKDSYIKVAFKSSVTQFAGSIIAETNYNIGYVKISNCYSEATIEGKDYTGGLVGRNNLKLTIENSHFSGKIHTLPNNYAAGLVGGSGGDSLLISNSFNSGNINGGAVAGLVVATGVFHIKNCYNSGSLSSEYNNVAGLVHSVSGPYSTQIYSTLENSYNTGKLYSDGSDMAELVGYVKNCGLSIINSYNDGDVSWKHKGYGEEGLVLHVTNGEVNIINSFNTQQTFDSTTSLKLIYQCNETSSCNIINSYALSESKKSSLNYNYSVTSKDLEDGSIAQALHDYQNGNINGSIWGQDVGNDVHPVYSGKVEYNTAEAHITPTIPKLVNGCYEIGNADELYGFALVVNGTDSTSAELDACGKLTADIVINERLVINDTVINERGRRLAKWTPINHFEGVFDGQGHSISGVYIDYPKQDSIGFFGVVGRKEIPSETTIKNVHIKDAYYRADELGGLVGWLHWSLTLSGCSFEGYIVGASAAGLIYAARELQYSRDEREFITIKNCYSKAIINAYWDAAGLIMAVDYYKDIRIEDSYAETQFTAPEIWGGASGLVHDMLRGRMSIVNSYSYNKLSDIYKKIGLVGSVGEPNPYQTQDLSIVNSYIHLDEPNKHVKNALLLYSSTYANISIKNSYYVADTASIYGGNLANRTDFTNGTIAAELHNYKLDGIDGSIWGQDVGTDPYPTLKGKVTGYTPTVLKLTLNTYNGDTTKYIDHFVLGHKIYPPKPKRKGYIFAGWFNNKELKGDAVLSIGVKDTNDVTLYAKWFEDKSLQPTNGCFEIGTAEELFQFAHYVNDTTRTNLKDTICAKLTADISINTHVLADPETLNEDAISFISWTPIMNFHGRFDGKGHSISGLYFNDERIDEIGLFGSVSFGENSLSRKDTTWITDLTLKDSYFRGNENVAGILAHATYSVVIFTNVHNEGFVASQTNAAGLIAGSHYNAFTFIDKSSNKGTIFGVHCAAGLVASTSMEVNISNSYNSGHITADYGTAGILADTYGDYNSVVEYTYNSGIISGRDLTGGIAGRCRNCTLFETANVGSISGQSEVGGLTGDLSGVIYNSYNSGKIEAVYKFGGLVGNANTIIITNSFNSQTIDVGDKYDHGGLVGTYEGWLNQIVTNSFFINTNPKNGFQDIQVTSSDFADGTVLKALQNYTDSLIDGKCWVQNIGKDPHPVLKGMNIVAYSSTSIATSTSSSSSSSSSSKKVSSSSSGKNVSSSSKKSTSSSSVKGSSSSSKKKKSSSSSKKSSLPENVISIHYNLSVEKRNVLITGVPSRTYTALFDMNGSLVDWDFAKTNRATLTAPRPGRYIVRIGSQTQSIMVR